MYFAQSSTLRSSQLCDKLTGATEIHDRGGQFVLEPKTLLYYVCLDNIGIMGLGPVLVDVALDQVERQLDELGLNTHEKVGTASWSENLGLVMDGKSGRCIPCPRRLSKIRHVLTWILRRPYLTGKQLEVLVGHCTFIGLLGRYSLSCFHTVYKFIQSGYDDRRRLWASVAAELRAFRGLLFVLESDWCKPWSPQSFCSNACETGWGCARRWRVLMFRPALGEYRNAAVIVLRVVLRLAQEF